MLRSGGILIAHPRHASQDSRRDVVLITESTDQSTMGLTLNKISHLDMYQLMQQKQIDWPGDREVYEGGNFNSNSLIILHSDEWYSSNTMQVDSGLAISSDATMLDKMEQGNTPYWYQLFIGCRAWFPNEIEEELHGNNPQWLYLPLPSFELVCTSSSLQWDHAVAEYSQDVFSNYI